MLKDICNANINHKVGNTGCPGVLARDTKTCNNSRRVKERIDEELMMRRRVTHGEGVKWADDKQAKTEKHSVGRAVEEAIREELGDRENETYA